MDIAARITLRELDDDIDRYVSQLLTRYQNLVKLCATPSGTSKEQAAQQSFQMQLEREALIKAAKDLLGVSRLMKQLWLAGPLREPGEDEVDPQMQVDEAKVLEMASRMLKQHHGFLQPAG